jgi:hypothetical protein
MTRLRDTDAMVRIVARMPQLIARFDVTGWAPRSIEGVDEAWAGAVEMRKSYTSGLVGESVALFVSSGTEEGQRSYLAVERITGIIDDGRSGSVTVHHGGLESSPQTWFGHVVPGTGTGDFADWSGSARIEHDEDGAYFVFELG